MHKMDNKIIARILPGEKKPVIEIYNSYRNKAKDVVPAFQENVLSSNLKLLK